MGDAHIGRGPTHTLGEIFNKRSRNILGRNLLDPFNETFAGFPVQLNKYLMNVSREIYCESTPIEFNPVDR